MKTKGRSLVAWKWNRSSLETKHREGPSWLLQMPLWCLSFWDSQGENICALCLLMKEKVAYGTELWTHQQRSIWSYQRTSSTTTFTSACSDPVKAASPSTASQQYIKCYRQHISAVLLPFTTAELAKLLCKDGRSSPALNPICSDLLQQVSLLSLPTSLPLPLGSSAVISSPWQKLPLRLLSYLWSCLFAPLCSKTLWVIVTCCLPILSSSSLVTHPTRLWSHNPTEIPPVEVTRGLHVAKYNGQFLGLFRLDVSPAFDTVDHSILICFPHCFPGLHTLLFIPSMLLIALSSSPLLVPPLLQASSSWGVPGLSPCLCLLFTLTLLLISSSVMASPSTCWWLSQHISRDLL